MKDIKITLYDKMIEFFIIWQKSLEKGNVNFDAEQEYKQHMTWIKNNGYLLNITCTIIPNSEIIAYPQIEWN